MMAVGGRCRGEGGREGEADKLGATPYAEERRAMAGPAGCGQVADEEEMRRRKGREKERPGRTPLFELTVPGALARQPRACVDGAAGPATRRSAPR